MTGTQDTEDVVARLRREGSSTLVYGEQIIRSRELANEAADLIQSLSDRIDVRDALLQRACWLMRPYCGGDEALRIFCDNARATLHQEGIAP